MADAILLYDGDCGFCNRAVRFVHARDKRGRYHYASLQGPTGQRLLAEHGLPTDRLDTMVLVEHGRAYARSTGALRVGRGLRWPWSWLAALGLLVPRPLRDWAYNLIARKRHRLLGAGPEACGIPPPELRARMLDSES